MDKTLIVEEIRKLCSEIDSKNRGSNHENEWTAAVEYNLKSWLNPGAYKSQKEMPDLNESGLEIGVQVAGLGLLILNTYINFRSYRRNNDKRTKSVKEMLQELDYIKKQANIYKLDEYITDSSQRENVITKIYEICYEIDDPERW